MDSVRRQTSIFRALLYCYPAEFRHEYGTEMEALFTHRLRSEPRFRLWLETVADVGFAALREHWHVLASDLRYGARVMAKSPGFTAIALAVIALGIGATVSVFSAVNAVLLRSLPYGHPEKLVYLWSPNVNLKGVPQELGPNVPDFYDWQRSSRSFSSMALFRRAVVTLARDGSAERAEAAFVTGSFFRTLEASAQEGRTIDERDDGAGHEHVAVISDALWRSAFHATPGAIGAQIQLNRHTYTIVGVMPKDFGYPFENDVPYEHSSFKQTDIWLPAAYSAQQKTDRNNFDSGDAIGRLRAGVTAAAAEAELRAIEARVQPLYPEMWRGWTALVRPLTATIVGPVEKMLWLLLGAVGIVMLIAISNVAGLLLARATVRAHELGVRTALGAERARIVRQLLTEALLLSGLGGALGTGLAYAIVHVMRRLNPGDVPRFETAAVDGRVFGGAVMLSVAAGILSGLAPAISASCANVNDLLRRAGGRVAGSANGGRFALIVLEVALSVVLLTGSGLLIRSYLALTAVNPGFSPQTLTFSVNLDERYNKPELRTALYQKFLQKLQNAPGVLYAGASNSNPLSNHESVTAVEIRGFGTSKEMVEARSITAEYRKALGTPLLRGRDFEPQDAGSKTPVALVNEKFAKQYFAGRNAVGGHVRIGVGDLSKAPWWTVVGVVGDIRHNSLEEESRAAVFQPETSGDHFAIRCKLPVRQVMAEARAALRSLDPALIPENVRTMSERVKESNARRTFQTWLLTGFAATAVALALAGLYGLMSYAVKQRTAEIGVRLAVGSPRGRILGLILMDGLRVTVCGLAIGLAGAGALGRLVSASLFGVRAIDPVTFCAVPLFVLAVACCACLIPAWTATKIDPVRALRQE